MENTDLIKIGLIIGSIAFSSGANAGSAEVKWQNPDKFRDIDPGNSTKDSYRKSIEKSFGEEFSKQAEKLPASQKLSVNVTNLDLAGEVDPIPSRGGLQLRVLKNIYYPQMTFDYKITGPGGSVVQEHQQVTIKDMGFMSGSANAGSSQDFYYERRMIREWFNKEVMPNGK
jgi:hypothetical protein